MTDEIIVIRAGRSPRLDAVLTHALQDVPHAVFDADALPELREQRVLFAVSVGPFGMDEQTVRLLTHIRRNPNCLEGAFGAMLIDADGELYSKQLAHMLMLSCNQAGCRFMGRPLVEATGSLHNLDVQSKRLGLDNLKTYYALAENLAHRLRDYAPKKITRPKLLVLHASNRQTSNTIALGEAVCRRLQDTVSIRELSLRNGTVLDCNGCSYQVCSHFAEQGDCFYGGAMVAEVYPAVLESDLLMILCPNYNDAVGANILAFINRLTSLTVNNLLEGKLLYSIVVSGYSGSDLVAQQLLGALSLNKAFSLPPRCCLMETANDPGAALRLPGIEQRIDDFAASILWEINRED